jgi:hypothetical protein
VDISGGNAETSLSRNGRCPGCPARLAGIVRVREIGEKPLKRLEEPSTPEKHPVETRC